MTLLENVVLSVNRQQINFVALISRLLDQPLEFQMLILTMRLLCNCISEPNDLLEPQVNLNIPL